MGDIIQLRHYWEGETEDGREDEAAVKEAMTNPCTKCGAPLDADIHAFGLKAFERELARRGHDIV